MVLNLTSGAIALTDSSPPISETSAPVVVKDIACTGNETKLLRCPYNSMPNYFCGITEDAGTVCQCVYLIEAYSY